MSRDITTPRGSAAPMKTPTACCANTLLKAPTCRSSRPTTSTTSQPNSTIDPAKHAPASPPPKPPTNSCPTRPTHPLLHPPPETTAACRGLLRLLVRRLRPIGAYLTAVGLL